jgi:acyl carrier protein
MVFQENIMDNNDVISKLKKLLVSVTNNSSLIEKLIGTSDLINEVGLDSIQMINFILLIEDEFGIEIDFENFNVDNLKSLDILCGYIINYINK